MKTTGFSRVSKDLIIAEVEKEVKSILAVPENLKIAFSVRLGYAVGVPPHHLRVRRDIEDFSHHNHFGNNGVD